MPQLPAPDAAALAHSHAVSRRIEQEITACGGWISFARFMELALYAPGLGYYSAGAAKFGSAGDFVTAPEISSLFGKTLAGQIAQILPSSGNAILEIGAGSGKLAVDLLLALEALDALPASYQILELSADLRERQRTLIEKNAPHLAARVSWLDCLPQTFSGVVLANEVLDAMSVRVIARREDGVYERCVISTDSGFNWSEQPLTETVLLEQAAALNLPQSYVTEIHPAAQALVASLAQMLQQGVLLFIDYGFGASEYYHPQRHQGTLMCHYRHHAHDDPFYLPGLQDITVHVDFSAIARAGVERGLDLLGYTNQANFLINCGIIEVLAETPAENTGVYLPLANQAQRLMSPAEMGELFKAIALGKGMSEALIGFVRGDKRHQL